MSYPVVDESIFTKLKRLEWYEKTMIELLEGSKYLLDELDKPNGSNKNVPCAKRVLKSIIAKIEGK